MGLWDEVLIRERGKPEKTATDVAQAQPLIKVGCDTIAMVLT